MSSRRSCSAVVWVNIRRAVVRLAAEKRRPPMSPVDLTAMLTKAGVPIFSRRLQTRFEDSDQV